jgi:hypothetical protein
MKVIKMLKIRFEALLSRTRIFFVAPISIVVAALTACGGGGGNAPASSPVPQAVTTTVVLTPTATPTSSIATPTVTPPTAISTAPSDLTLTTTNKSILAFWRGPLGATYKICVGKSQNVSETDCDINSVQTIETKATSMGIEGLQNGLQYFVQIFCIEQAKLPATIAPQRATPVAPPELKFKNAFPSMLNISYGNGRYVAVGEGIQYSTDDGSSWIHSDRGNEEFVEITFAFGNFIAAKKDLSIWKSPNGLDWVSIYTPTASATSKSVRFAFGNGRLLVTFLNADFNSSLIDIAVTDNLTSWVTGKVDPTGGAYPQKSAIFHQGKFYIWNRSTLTSPDGVTWTKIGPGQFDGRPDTPCILSASDRRNFPSGNGEKVVSFQNMLLVPDTGTGCLNSDGTNGNFKTYSSSDALTWDVAYDIPANQTSATFKDQNAGLSIAFNKITQWTYKPFAKKPVSYVTSSDGVNWSPPTITELPVAGATIHGASACSATSCIQLGYNNLKFRTVDGINWKYINGTGLGSTLFLGAEGGPSIAYGNGRFVITQLFENSVKTSVDGTTWAQYDTPFAQGNIVFFRNKFWAFTYNTSDTVRKVLSSQDGIVWTIQPNTVFAGYQELSAYRKSRVFGNSLYSVGSSGVFTKTSDGTNWASFSTGVTTTLLDIAASTSKLAAVGTGGAIVTSDDDGVTWQKRLSGTTNKLFAITFFKDKFYAAGANLTLLVSSDGVVWNAAPTPSLESTLNFYIADGKLTAVGDKGLFMQTSDGVAWSAPVYLLPSGGYHYQGVYGNGRHVLSGQSVFASE